MAKPLKVLGADEPIETKIEDIIKSSPKLDEVLIGTEIKKGKPAGSVEPDSTYTIKGIYKAKLVDGEPVLLVYTYHSMMRTYQIVDYQTGTTCQLGGPQTTLDLLLAKDHGAYFESIRLRDFKDQPDVDHMLRALSLNAIKKLKVLNAIPQPVMCILSSQDEVPAEMEDMF